MGAQARPDLCGLPSPGPALSLDPGSQSHAPCRPARSRQVHGGKGWRGAVCRLWGSPVQSRPPPPPFSMSAHAPHCCGRHPLPQGSASQRSVAERSDDDFDFFSSAGAWGGRLFCFLDPSGEFSARQSSRRFPCFLMLL